MSSLLDKRLLFVAGKGGVGKTTVAAALGLVAARRGKRTIICEVAEQERLPGLLGIPSFGHRETELRPGLYGFSVNPERAKEEWLRYQLHSATVASLLAHSRVFHYLTAAAPGLTELVTVGKIWELAQLKRKTEGASPYDLVLVDAPATGHAVAMLAAPRTFSEVARVGPIHRQAGMIHSFIADPHCTGVLAVALPEEMAVNETLELGGRLQAERGAGVDAVVVNGLYPERFTREEAELLQSLDGRRSPRAGAAVRAALSEYRRARSQRSQLRRLRRGGAAPVTTLPYLFVPDLGPKEVEELSAELDRRL